MERFNTPILFIIFNRQGSTEKVFNEIKKQRPKYLYIAGDGPRENHPQDKENCRKTREIINQIDWNCKLKTLFREENLGCGKAVSGAINWFFKNVDKGIILEDDCLPHLDFFSYCEELLNKYEDNNQIKLITGDNFQNGIKRGEASYYFSAYTHIWGWASWKRTWDEYDFTLDSISKKEFKKSLKDYSFSWSQRMVWLDKFVLMRKNKIDTWDYQLSFCIWKNKGINIIPNVNLISNIGFGENSTHTKDIKNPLANIPTNNILPLSYPKKILMDKDADNYTNNKFYRKNLIQLVYRCLKRSFYR